MTLERSTLLFREIASSTDYSSVRSLLDEPLSTSIDAEKLVRLCLRKLSDWFQTRPSQIQEIKVHFHRYFLRTPFSFAQKRLFDLLLGQLGEHLDDYLLFLLVDLFEKNYSIFLDELIRENDVTYLIHLPDRVNNVCEKNTPRAFQLNNYFRRLSEEIEKRLINEHYPRMVNQLDTNVQYLSQVIHRAARLGYTQYLWRPLSQRLFEKKCPTDPLWLRLAQYFLFDTIDDVLLDTIEHGNARTLDLFLSERILHVKPLEIYLTETLLFRKQLSIESIRSLLIYFCMSSNRVERCFHPVFVRFLNLWSDESFIRFASDAQHLSTCQSICVCLSLSEHCQTMPEKEKLILSLLNGIRLHLESTFDSIRRRGQVIGELLVERLNLFSSANQLHFQTYDVHHPEVLQFRQLAEKHIDGEDRPLADHDDLPSTTNLVVPPVDRPSNGVVLRDAAVDDEDDQSIDSEFPSYDYSHDTIKSDVSKPTYIRTCLADLLATEKVPQLEAALHVLPSLIEMSKVECEEVAVELVRILLNYNSTFEIDNFHQLQFQALTSLCSTYPLLVSDYLCQQFYERNYTLQQRSLILKTIQESAKRLAQIEQIRSHIEEDEEESEEDDPWRSVIHQRLKLKTKYKRSAVARTASKVKKENHFGSLVGHFFYPLISQIDRSSPHLALIDGDQDHLLLCELLACLGRLCIHGQNTVILLALVKAFLQVLMSLREHADAGVRHAVVYAYACCFVSLNGHCPDDDLQSALIELKQWFDALIARDSNSEVQKLARSVRQILLKSLQEISLSQC